MGCLLTLFDQWYTEVHRAKLGLCDPRGLICILCPTASLFPQSPFFNPRPACLPVGTMANLTRVPVGQGQCLAWGLGRAHPGTTSPQDVGRARGGLA